MNTQWFRTCIAAAISALLCTATFAQQGPKPTYKVSPGDSLYEDMEVKKKTFMEDRINNAFPPYGKVQSIDGEVFDFDHIHKPALILVGHANCFPCTIQLPLLISFARQKRYSNIDFIYITPDDAVTVHNEAGKKGYDRVKVFCFSRRYIIDTMATTSMFPTVYFMNAKGLARIITTGGPVGKDAVPFLKKKWGKYIDSLYTN